MICINYPEKIISSFPMRTGSICVCPERYIHLLKSQSRYSFRIVKIRIVNKFLLNNIAKNQCFQQGSSYDLPEKKSELYCLQATVVWKATLTHIYHRQMFKQNQTFFFLRFSFSPFLITWKVPFLLSFPHKPMALHDNLLLILWRWD